MHIIALNGNKCIIANHKKDDDNAWVNKDWMSAVNSSRTCRHLPPGKNGLIWASEVSQCSASWIPYANEWPSFGTLSCRSTINISISLGYCPVHTQYYCAKQAVECRLWYKCNRIAKFMAAWNDDHFTCAAFQLCSLFLSLIDLREKKLHSVLMNGVCFIRKECVLWWKMTISRVLFIGGSNGGSNITVLDVSSFFLTRWHDGWSSSIQL